MTTTTQVWIAVGILAAEMLFIGIVLIYGFQEEWRGLDDDPDKTRWID